MTDPSPLQAAPAMIRRQLLVAEAMQSVADLATLPVGEQLVRLGEAQAVLAAVLDNAEDLTQLPLTGLTRGT